MGCTEAKGSSERLWEGNEGSQKSESESEINLHYVDPTLGVHRANKSDKFASKFWPLPQNFGKSTKNSIIDSYLWTKDDFEEITEFPWVVCPQLKM